MTYSIDLARNTFYAGRPEYTLAVLHPLSLDLAVTVALFVVFTVISDVLLRARRSGAPGHLIRSRHPHEGQTNVLVAHRPRRFVDCASGEVRSARTLSRRRHVARAAVVCRGI